MRISEYDEGRYAFIEDKKRDSNPHRRGSKKSYEWLWGWESARADVMEGRNRKLTYQLNQLTGATGNDEATLRVLRIMRGENQ